MENKQLSKEESEPRGSGESEDAQRVQGHDRLHCRLAGRCSKRRAGTTKGERKTANSPFTPQTQVRVVWKTERDHQAYRATFLGELLIEPVDESQPGNWLEIDGIVCHKHHIVRQGSSCDHRIQVRHEGATRRTFFRTMLKY